MGVASKYWIHTRLEASGQLSRREIGAAKTFFQQEFPNWAEMAEIPDMLIHQHLFQHLQLVEEGSSASAARLAACCLRCFISNQIPTLCIGFMRKFGLQQYLTQTEMLSYVLDDTDPFQAFDNRAAYLPFAIKILQTFQPNQGSLTTWIKRLIAQHSGLNRTLRSYGIYIASDWAILNNVTSLQVQRLLSDRLTDSNIQQTCHILASFHQVYRFDRMQQRSSKVGQSCSDPTPDQLQRMLQLLETAGIVQLSPQQLLQELRFLAYQLRQSKRPPILSLDDRSVCFLAEQQQNPQSEEEEFLIQYRSTSEETLYQAVRQVLDQQIATLRSCKPAKVEVFLKALALFFLQQKSMSEIAHLVGLEKQFQVSRLLQIKKLRAAVEQQWLPLLQTQLRSLLADYVAPEQQEQIQLDGLLVEMIDRVMAEDITECYSTKRNASSLLGRCICRYLESCLAASSNIHQSIDKPSCPR